MRLFEIFLLLLTLALVFLTGQLRGFVAAALTAFAGLLLALHMLVEEPRWQMVPLYILLFLLVGMLHFNVPLRAVGRAGACLFILLAALPPMLVPVNSLPAPTGPYAVGTTVFDWTDPARPEGYTDDPDDARRIMVQVWYPAAPAQAAQPAPYHTSIDELQSPLAQFLGLPPVFLSHLRLVRTHAFLDAPPAGEEPFPVIVFSHGWRGMRVQNTFQVEELASHGYVVFSADHTFGAVVTVFSDGQVRPYNPAALPSGVSDDEYDQAARVLGQAWSGDIRFIFDQAVRLNSGEIESPLAGRLDLAKIGVMGHSTGGGAAVEACWLDARCQAGLAMDAWMIPYDRRIPELGLNQPFMFMASETWSARRNPPLVNALLANLHGDAYYLKLLASDHTSFSDMPLFVPLLARIQTGGLWLPSPQERVNAYSLAFFDRHLKGFAAPLLDPQAAPLRGVVYQTRPR